MVATREQFGGDMTSEMPGLPRTPRDAAPQRPPKLFPNEVTETQIYPLENLCGIPKEINSELHLRQIDNEWKQFYKTNPNATQAQLLRKATEIDAKFGSQFRPPMGGG
jgi:hypothetical protein